jgi:hypothetical protein
VERILKQPPQAVISVTEVNLARVLRALEAALAIVRGNFGSDSESPIGERGSITH